MGLTRSAMSCVVAIVAALIALPASATTVPVASLVTAYTYDAPIYDSPGNDSVQERGPPKVTVAHTTYDAVDSLSHGALTRPEAPPTPSISDCLRAEAVAQGVRTTPTTGGPAALVNGHLSRVHLSGVAAKTGDDVFSAGKYLKDSWYKNTFPNRTSLEAGGVRTRPDLFVELPCGARCFLEVKTGPGAGLTRNQATGFPSIRSSGAVPRGANAAAAGLTPGVPMGPTPVWIVRPPWPLW